MVLLSSISLLGLPALIFKTKSVVCMNVCIYACMYVRMYVSKYIFNNVVAVLWQYILYLQAKQSRP